MLPGVGSARSVRRGPRYSPLGVRHEIMGEILTTARAAEIAAAAATSSSTITEEVSVRVSMNVEQTDGALKYPNG